MLKLISEKVGAPKVELLTETTKSGKFYYIEGIFAQAEVVNGNRRRYPHDILMKEVERYCKESVASATSTGELDHPESASINLDRVSHVITELKIDGNDVYGKARVLNTPMGKIAQQLIEGGVKLGVSTRGLASVTEDKDDISVVEDDFNLLAVDIVGTPSAPNAYVNGVLEGYDVAKARIGSNAKRINEARMEFLKRFLATLAK